MSIIPAPGKTDVFHPAKSKECWSGDECMSDNQVLNKSEYIAHTQKMHVNHRGVLD